MNIKKRIGKTSFGVLLLTIVVVVLVSQISALPEYSSELQKIYGNGSCTTCHIKPSDTELTEYGKKFSVQPDHVNDPIMALRVIGVPGETINVTTTEKTEKKSPGFEIVMTIGMISAIYILRKNRIR